MTRSIIAALVLALAAATGCGGEGNEARCQIGRAHV